MREINIYHFQFGHSVTTADEMVRIAGGSFEIGQRVPEAAGEAFDLQAWYNGWSALQEEKQELRKPAVLKVEAADSFEATIPWGQLDRAAVVFSLDGKPLEANGPIRLYVPDGSSRCLNVKRIVALYIGNAGSDNGEAAYGFKQTFTLDEMRKK